MKKIVKIGVVLIVLLTGFSKIADATCEQVQIVCAGGSAHILLVCGDSNEDRLNEYKAMCDMVCGEQAY